MSNFISTKTPCQCRSHHQKFFHRIVKDKFNRTVHLYPPKQQKTPVLLNELPKKRGRKSKIKKLKMIQQLQQIKIQKQELQKESKSIRKKRITKLSFFSEQEQHTQDQQDDQSNSMRIITQKRNKKLSFQYEGQQQQDISYFCKELLDNPFIFEMFIREQQIQYQIDPKQWNFNQNFLNSY